MDLFFKHGYEGTSIESIVNKAEVSKGAFFHHFKSKEDILSAIAEKYSLEVVQIMQKIADQPKLNAVEKFNKVIREGKKYKVAHSIEYRKVNMLLLDYKNVFMQHQIMERMIDITIPPIEKIIIQGTKEGLFKVEFPKETAEAYVRFLFMAREPMMKILKNKKKPEDFAEDILRQVKFYENMMNRMLGAEPGAIKLPKINKQLIKLVKLFIK